ncbi:MAG TPA: tripartite tricarboxylate transporter substrate binding protein [Ramlibacter sp.]|nr:tripartite tricarboxylate transporter substrate binding protein [Ramlibacter sp.]
MKDSSVPSPSRRRAMLRLAAAAAALAPSLRALAQAARPYRVVVGSPPGALGDVLARLLAQKLGDATGQPAIVDNRPGAAGAIAADFVAKSAGDGHTLVVVPDAVMVVNPFIYPKLPYDPIKDFQSVALLGKASLALIVSPKLNVKTLADFVQLAKAKPKAINFGSGGAGHPTHMVMELVSRRLGIQLTHVPYKGTSPSIQGLLGGEVGAMITGVVEAMPHIKAGTVIPLAASGPAAKEIFPGLPQFKEFHEELDVSVWFGVFAPASTPREVVSTLNAQINKALGEPDVQKRLGEYGLMPTPVPTTDLDKLVKLDLARFGPLVKALGLVAN